MANSKRGPLLDHLDDIELMCTKGKPTLEDIVNVFGADGHFVLMTFLLVPFLQPVPVPGLSTVFGIMITTVAILAYFKKPPWLPRRFAKRKIDVLVVSRIAEGTERIFEKLHRFLHPRWKFLFLHPFRFISVVLLVLNAILLALPLPIPFSNAIPAWMILFQVLGHLEEDGFFIILSYAQTIICVAYFVVIIKSIESGFQFIGL